MELEFHILDVVDVLRLPYPERDRISYNIPCPCCDDKPHGKHLNINIKRDVFRCPRCDTKGGVYDLYSLFSGVPRSQARQALRERLGRDPSYKPKRRKPIEEMDTVQECPITDIDARHATYTALLSKLKLASDHKENLLGRGLSETEIEQLGYKTTPIVGMSIIAQQLQSEGLYLAGVPGFYRAPSGNWTFVSEKRGILLPVRDLQGRIQGMQIRLDNAAKRKFRWLSSAERLDGCQAEGRPHLVGKIQKTIIITEGVMKADIIHALSGRTVLAVPGVHSLSRLKEPLQEMQEMGLQEVKTAFDMDFMTNHHVQEAMDKLLELLDELGFKYSTYVWDSRYKGLDDYIWEFKMKKQR